MVGTHKDLVKSPAELEKISKLLYDTFKHKPAWSSVDRFEKATGSSGRGNHWFFPVDNTIGNRDPQEQGKQSLTPMKSRTPPPRPPPPHQLDHALP